MVTIKSSGFDQLAKHLQGMADRINNLDGTRFPLRCSQCGSTKLVFDDELGEDAPIRCENEHVLGLKKDAEKLLAEQVEAHIATTLRGDL